MSRNSPSRTCGSSFSGASRWLGLLFMSLAGLLGGCGGGGGGGENLTSWAAVDILAGNGDGPGYLDGTGVTARFNNLSGVAVDGSGNVYVADTDSHVIRKITPAGVTSTFAGSAGQSGSANGSGSAARFNRPSGVAVDSGGNIYVADTDNHLIRKITPAGVTSTLAGSAGVTGSTDGTGSGALFYGPLGVAVDSSGIVYVSEAGNRTIRVIALNGAVTTLAGSASQPAGTADGLGAIARFRMPNGIAVDASFNVYVADTEAHTVRMIAPGGLVSTLAGQINTAGSSDGLGTAAQFDHPTGVTYSAGNVYVADQFNCTLRKIDSGTMVSTVAGEADQCGITNAVGTAARFSYPVALAADSAGNIYVADYNNQVVRKVTTPSNVVTTLAGSAWRDGTADGAGAQAGISGASGMVADSAGNMYFADHYNHTIRKITAAGIVSTIAGLAGVSGSTDGSGSAARFKYPTDVAIDGSGNLYVADAGNSTIRKITPAGAVTTLAGAAGAVGSLDATGSSARFNAPTGIAADAAGNVYVADYSNYLIRKVTSGGVVTTIAGTAGAKGSADGTGAAARFSYVSDVALDGAGNIYVTDTGNLTVRKITPGAVVSTVAGSPGVDGRADGTGSSASFAHPTCIDSDSSGNLYVCDTTNHTLRKVSSAGAVTTLVGTAGIGTVGAGALPGTLSFPKGVARHGGILYIASLNAIVRAATQ